MRPEFTDAARRRVIKCLIAIATDAEQKAGDRISAAKLLLDRERTDSAADGAPVTVVFKDIPPEYYR